MFHGAFNYCLLCHCRHLSLQIDGIITTQAEIHSAVCPPLPSQPPQLPLSKLFIRASHSSPWKRLCPFPTRHRWPRLGTVVMQGGHGRPGDLSDPPLSKSVFYQADPTPHRGFVQLVWPCGLGHKGGSDTPKWVTEPPSLRAPHSTHLTCRAHPTHQPKGPKFLVRRNARVCRHRVYRTPVCTPSPVHPHTREQIAAE